MQGIVPEAGVNKVWAMPGGTITYMDAMFQDTFGSRPEEWMDRPIASMALDSDIMSQ